MRIKDIIAQMDIVKPNSFPPEWFVGTLSNYDRRLYDNVIGNFEGTVEPYKYVTVDDELVLPDEYSEIYIAWLSALIDNLLGDTRKYQNSLIFYNTAFDSFVQSYTKNHTAKTNTITTTLTDMTV